MDKKSLNQIFLERVLKVLLISQFLVPNMRLMADPADPSITKKIILGDGIVDEVRLVGDEFFFCWRSISSGKYYHDDGKYGLKEISLHDIKAQRALSFANRETCDRLQLPDKQNCLGVKQQLVILVEFSDISFSKKNDVSFYNRFFNEPNFSEGRFNGSVRDYFLSQSNGQLDLNFEVVGPIHLSKPHSYYGYREAGEGVGDNVKDMVQEAITLADSQIDFSRFDWNGDGFVEQVSFVFAGLPYNLGGDRNSIWSHKWEIKPLFLDQIAIENYCCVGELRKIDEQITVNGIGTFCHEFSHCLGLPDTYDGEDFFYGLTTWDLMGGGNHNNYGFTPAGFTALDKMLVGWQEPIILYENAYIHNMASMNGHGDFYMVCNDNEPNEFFLLEYRGQDGWDSCQYGKGMLITQVNLDEQFEKGIVNNSQKNTYERYRIVQADDNPAKTVSGYKGDLFPFGEKDSFCDNTTSAATLFHANLDGSYNLNKSISNIRFDGTNCMAFDFRNDNSNSEYYGMSLVKKSICLVNRNTIKLTATIRNNSYRDYSMPLAGFCRDVVGNQSIESYIDCFLASKEETDVDFFFENVPHDTSYKVCLYYHPRQGDAEWKSIIDEFEFSLDEFESNSIVANNLFMETVNETTVRFHCTLENKSFLSTNDMIYVYVRYANEESFTGWVAKQLITSKMTPFMKNDYYVDISGLEPYTMYYASVFRYQVAEGKWVEDNPVVNNYRFFIRPDIVTLVTLPQDKPLNDSDAIYTLIGQKVGHVAKDGSLPILPSGIYFIGGKKIHVNNH